MFIFFGNICMLVEKRIAEINANNYSPCLPVQEGSTLKELHGEY